MANISIIGGGSWGLAMSLVLHKNSHTVTVWEHNRDSVIHLQKYRKNENYLPGIVFPDDINFTNDMQDLFISPPDFIVFAVPSTFLRQTVRKASQYIQKGNLKAIVNLAKGLEEDSLKRMSSVITEELPASVTDLICTLSGPSHAEEVARKIPTLVVVAGKNQDDLQKVQKAFSNAVFRVYSSDDIIGVEIGAAVKNIIAIAAGVVDGLGFGDNTKGALLTRGLVEIKRLGLALNAEEKTFSGLSGLGDLVTTAISPHSRNRHVGYHLGKGEKLGDILNQMVMIAEGVITTKTIRELKEKLGVSMPITEEMYQLMFQNKDPRDALYSLMTRGLKSEFPAQE